MRILITGSREWTDKEKILKEVEKAANDYYQDDITIVHGACPTGADKIADELNYFDDYPEVQITIERHPANWNKHGKGAGPIRNQKMVNLGADICLAFICPNSKGTKDCIERAWKAGIPVRIFPDIE